MSPLLHFAAWCVGLARVRPVLLPDEAVCLGRLAAGRRRIAEIGVWHGGSTRLMRDAMAADGVLVAVDPFVPGRLGFSPQRVIARREVARGANGRVIWIRERADEAARDVRVRDGGFDLVFLDAQHTYDGLRDEWTAWSPLVAPNGLVAIHDSRAHPKGKIDDLGSVRFTTEVILQDPRFILAEAVDSLTVVRRR